MRFGLCVFLVVACSDRESPPPTPAPKRAPSSVTGMTGPEEVLGGRALVRRGSIALPAGPMQFALIGDESGYGQDHLFLAFDLDRNGTLDVNTLDNPELFHVFEKNVTLDGTSYAFAISLDGAALTLRRLADKLPPRVALTTGTLAPDFSVTDLDGKRTTLSALRDKVVLLDFWATSCKPCVKALPALAEMRATYAPRGFELVSIAMESDDVRETLGTHRMGVVAIDEAAQTLYRVDRFPTYFLIGKGGTILCSHCRLDKVTAMVAEQLP